MQSFIIEGGHMLSGTIVPQGAKNEALQVICASLLTAEKVRICNVPDILDVNNLIQLLRDMGVKVEKLGDGDYTFCADNLNLDYLGIGHMTKEQLLNYMRNGVYTPKPGA